MGQRVVYFDPFAGAAGDMINAALIDAGADLAAIQAAVASVDVAGLAVRVAPVMKSGVGALKYIVEVDEAAMPDHLGPDDLLALVERAAISEVARARARNIIERLAGAEARVHRVDRAAVRFHELGGLDTIADVVGAVVALESLGVERCLVGPLPVGAGVWGMAHGAMPLPSPATIEIIARGSLAVIAAPPEIPAGTELVTPTGAAILAEVAESGLPPLALARVGYGAGTRDLAVPNILRAWVGTLA